MGGFPHLEALITTEMFVYRSKEITVKSTARPTNFGKLVFNSARVDPEMLVDWMTQESIINNVEYLACCPIQQVGVPPVGKLLTAMGTSLKHFKIALVGLVSQGGFIELIERSCMLTWNMNLRVLEFGSPAAYAAMYGADDISFTWFPTMLGQVTSPVIETVAFNLWEGDLDGVSSNAWDNIVYVLSSEQFAPLKKIAFHVWGDPAKTSNIVKAVKTRFTSFDERGLLHIDDVPDPACS
ncbi:hypothetical protein NM688_g5292 [Phlebia brevispora]|uniref:Uncharacterized protein n=1 Tax=Phlebia brevispora TaxID=194682 RepID=A0ACC1SXU7_9APHY|nr:hypothetical protein NM688_g5292 [Phlebia brevispora]